MEGSAERTEAFRRLYQAHYQAVAAYTARRLDPQEADDVVAEIFMVAWRRLTDIPADDLTLPWLFGVGRRVVSQHWRSGRRRNRLLARLSQTLSLGETPSVEMERLEGNVVVETALSDLGPNDQELLRLAEWEELTVAELAQVFGCSTNAISVRLHRAHRRFAKALSAADAGNAMGPREEASR